LNQASLKASFEGGQWWASGCSAIQEEEKDLTIMIMTEKTKNKEKMVMMIMIMKTKEKKRGRRMRRRRLLYDVTNSFILTWFYSEGVRQLCTLHVCWSHLRPRSEDISWLSWQGIHNSWNVALHLTKC
jgi:hypothetical protein